MTRPRRGAPLPPIRLRLTILFAVMTLAFLGIGARLVELQARDQTHLQSLGVGQRVQTVTLPAERGSIFDRNGVDLALSVPQTTIVADPHVIHDPKAFAAKLAPVAVVERGGRSRPSCRNRRAGSRTSRARSTTPPWPSVKKLDLNGLSYIPESKRFYPSGLLAAPVLGFVGTDDYGLAGLESFYEKSLQGRAGEARIERDPQGNEIPGGADVVEPAERGKDIVLTIDQSIQASAEHTLTQQVEDAGAKGGMAIVADVRTGDILAMATVDGATDGRPRRPGAGDGAEQARDRGLRARVDQQGHHDGRRDRGRRRRARDRDRRRRQRGRRRRHDLHRRRHPPVHDDGRGDPRALVERRDDHDRRHARQGALRPLPPRVRVRPADRARLSRRSRLSTCCRSRTTTTRAWARCRSGTASRSARSRCSTST